MNKKRNTVLFILGATVLNILLMLVLFTALFLLFGTVIAPRLPEEAISIGVLLVFILSIVGTYFVYHLIVKLISSKIDMEAYFEPIFKRRQGK